MSLTTFLSKILGNKSQRDLKEIKPTIDKINAIGPTLKGLSNDELRGKIDEVRADLAASTKDDQEAITSLKEKIEELPFDERQPLWDEIDQHEKKILDTLEDKLNEHLPIVFATMRETAARFAANETIEVTATDLDRKLAVEGREFVTIDGDKAIWKNKWMAGGNEITWDMIHYDVQLIGGVVLHSGKIAEMATGEGKTLVATLPVFLRSLSRRGVHVVTVNDYLSKRDSEWMGPLYMFHGSTVDCIDKHRPNTRERRNAYECDITFGTNNEFGFDYLRDNMAISPKDLVQRQHNYAIVDDIFVVFLEEGVCLEELGDGVDALRLDGVVGHRLILELLALRDVGYILQLRELGGNVGKHEELGILVAVGQHVETFVGQLHRAVFLVDDEE